MRRTGAPMWRATGEEHLAAGFQRRRPDGDFEAGGVEEALGAVPAGVRAQGLVLHQPVKAEP